MNKTTKILAVLFIYFFLLVIDGCVNCKCPDNILGYFDFKKLTQEVNSTSLSEFAQLEITSSYDDISYLAKVEQPCWNLGLINTATACSCLEAGGNGLKFPLTDIKISSDQEMSPSLPAESSLDSSFYIIELDNNSNEISKTLLADYNLNEASWFNWEGVMFKFQSVNRPEELGIPHIFKIEITKSNGEIIFTQTQPITWN